MNNNEVLQSGTSLYNGKYRIESVIEHGGLGITYKATLVQLDVSLIVKELFLAGKCVREEDNSISLQSFSEKRFKAFKDNFIEEGKALAKFKHPNLIQIRDIIEENNTVYLVMDYVEERTLEDYVTEKGRLSEDETLSYIMQIGSALKEVHEKGFLHKDVQPSNILITEEGKVMLVGLGVTGQFVSAATKASSSPSYAPMEQYIAQYTKIDKSGHYTDVYSLAATLYYCLLGEHPISPVERQNTELTPPQYALASISNKTNNAILKGMAMDGAERHQSIADFLSDVKPEGFDALNRTNTLNKGTRLLDGKYRIEKVLGMGGLGITYKATLLKLDLTVVIKELFLPGFCNRESDNALSLQSMTKKEFSGFKTQFLEEGKILAKTQHDHIAQVKDTFSENNTVYLVMEYVEGISLQKMVEEKGRLSEVNALQYIRQVAAGLQVVHEKGFLHKDVRPANIVITSQRGAVLVGLGVAKDKVKNNTNSSEAGFAPMEQYASEAELSKATDIYALAASLYYCLAGERPISAFDRYYTEMTPVKNITKSVSKRSSDTIAKAMAMKMNERYEEVVTFVEELEEIDPAVVRRKKMMRGLMAAASIIAVLFATYMLTREAPPPKIAVQDYNQFLNAAQDLSKNGHYKKAENYYKGLLLVNPNDPKAIAGKAYTEKGKLITINWWNDLDEAWKGVFRKAINFKNAPNPKQLGNIFKLKELYCYDTQITSLQPIENLINVEILGIYNSPIKDLSPVSNLIKLKELDCSSTQITTLAPLENLKKLTKLDCSKTDITSLEPVRGLDKLKELRCANTQIKTLDPIRPLKNLTTLSCAKTGISNLEPVKGLDKLKELYIYSTQVKNLAPIKDLTYLETLHCYKTPLSNLSAVSNMQNLKELHCYNTQIVDIEPIGTLPNLKEFFAYSTNISSLAPLSKAQNLTHLKCYNTKISSLAPISNLQNLKELYCNKTPISDLSDVRNLINLTHLDFSTTQVADLSPLSKLKNLEFLSCYSTQINTLNPLRTLFNLKELNCANAQLTSLEPLSNLSNLTSLDCSSTQINTLEPIQSLTAINKLNFSSTQVNTLEAVQNMSNLKTLKLTGTNVSSKQIDEFKQKHSDSRVEF